MTMLRYGQAFFTLEHLNSAALCGKGEYKNPPFAIDPTAQSPHLNTDISLPQHPSPPPTANSPP
jgi:hypothetical protein